MVAMIIGGAIVLAPIITKYRPWPWRLRVPFAGGIPARAGYFAMFVMSAIHLTNMRITPLIYFKF